MSGTSSFNVSYPSAFSCDRERIVLGFLEHKFSEHFRDRFASPLVFMPEPGHPELFETVRHILKTRAGEAGAFAAKLNGSTLLFRIEDQGEDMIMVRLERTSIRPSPIDEAERKSAS
jgi:hypothetical protein